MPDESAYPETTPPREPMPGIEPQPIPQQFSPDPTLMPPMYGQPGYQQPNYGQPAPTQPMPTQPMPTQPMPTQPMPARPDQGFPPPAGYGQPDPQQPGYGAPGYGAPGYGAPGYGAPGYGAPGYGAPGYGYAPATPPKKSRTGLIIGLVVLALVVCGGAAAAAVALVGSANSAKNSAASSTNTPTSTGTSPSPSPSGPVTPDHSGDLRRFLVSAPSSSRPWKTPMGAHNSFTAAQESKDWDNSAYRKNMLASHNFDIGAVRQWETSSSLVSVELFRFASADDADQFTAEETSGVSFFSEPQTEKTISGVESGNVYYTKKRDTKHNTHAFGVGRCGDVVIEVWVDTYGSVSTDYVATLVRKEYAKLCS